MAGAGSPGEAGQQGDRGVNAKLGARALPHRHGEARRPPFLAGMPKISSG